MFYCSWLLFPYRLKNKPLQILSFFSLKCNTLEPFGVNIALDKFTQSTLGYYIFQFQTAYRQLILKTFLKWFLNLWHWMFGLIWVSICYLNTKINFGYLIVFTLHSVSLVILRMNEVLRGTCTIWVLLVSILLDRILNEINGYCRAE